MEITMPIEPESVISAKEQTKNVKLLWGGLRPPVHIIYPAWDAKRWMIEFEKVEKRTHQRVRRVVDPPMG